MQNTSDGMTKISQPACSRGAASVTAHRVAALGFGLALLLASASSQSVEANDDRVTFFENHIRPILVEHCFECHNGVKQEGGVRLDVRDGMLAGGDSGPSIVPGKPEESLLVEAIRYQGYEMPPAGKLPDEDIEKVVRWIRQGAHWPANLQATQPALGDQAAIKVAADEHWAFRPVESKPLPEVADPDWARSPIDRYVRARLESHGLRPSPPASRPELIRRAFVDLIGLPPTPEVVAEVFGTGSLAGINYSDIVDGLLASPHYGERMARHWMDVARYADTRDFLAAADLRYPFAYTYRDWLIRAFNDDMPYDEFVTHQLAADAIAERDTDPNLAALGFLTVGPMYRNDVNERIADRIDTVTRGLMGMTASCARCHDHKYDPISIEDYYSLYAVFRDSTPPDELPVIESPLGNEPPGELKQQFEEAYHSEVAKLEAYKQELADKARADLIGRFDEYLQGYVEMNLAKTETTRGLKSKRKLEETALTPVAANLDRFRQVKRNEGNPVLGPLVALGMFADADFPKRRDAYLKKYGERLIPPIRAAAAQSKTRLELAAKLGQVLNGLANASEVDHSIRDSILDPQQGPFAILPDAAARASRLLGTGRKKLQDFDEAIRDVESTHPGAPPKAMSVRDTNSTRPVFVMLRGEPSRRGPKVERGFLDYFAASENEQRFQQGSGRRDLAAAITSRDNPLTRRVLVNRVWRMHFGSGLVRDAGDFGLRSDTPVAADLLDWQANSFASSGWSLKQLHRQIMLSNTYRQSSHPTEPPQRPDGTSADEIDAENTLLWRQNRRRVDFETMRDSMLAAAGTLDLQLGGKSVRLSDTPHPTRRTLYAYIDRVEPNPIFATFDVASPDVTTAQRAETLVPQQALFAMNNQFVIDQARAIVDTDQFANLSESERIDHLAQRIFQRSARPNEQTMIAKFVASAGQLMDDHPEEWTYGIGPSRDGVETFAPLTHFDGSRYTFASTFPSTEVGYAMLTATGGHPGKRAEQSVIRRWTVPKSMTVRIGGTLERKSKRGDGVKALVRINGKSVADFSLKTGTTPTGSGFHTLSEGDRVDFIVDPLGTSTSDSFVWRVLIEERSPDRREILSRRSSPAEFASPPPPPMTPWEQAAHALLLTNEFLFVD